jgi:hypothetical protein
LFVDDCFLFFGLTEDVALTMKNILATYEVESDRSINLLKLEFFCSCIDLIKNFLANILGVQQVLTMGKNILGKRSHDW